MPLRRAGKLQETRHDSIADFMAGFGNVFREGVPGRVEHQRAEDGKRQTLTGHIGKYDKETYDARLVRALPFAVDRR